MVEVTRSNFEAVMPDVEEAIKNASFIAFDAEFTGLSLGACDSFSLFDSMNERYTKLKTRASNFTISQIGISAFTKDRNKNSYQVETYVFYIRPYLCGSTDKRFMCQASCLDFLCRHGFDFNKFIKEGVPFINNIEEKQLWNEIEEGSIIYPYDLLEIEQDVLINDEFLSSAEQNRVNMLDEDESSNSVQHGKRIVLPKDKSASPLQ